MCNEVLIRLMVGGIFFVYINSKNEKICKGADILIKVQFKRFMQNR